MADAAARPSITLKWAQTLDGRLATRTGHSQWISGIQARAFAHQLRAEHDAILVGVRTVIADNPELTTRLVEGPDPTRVVLDGRLRTPEDARVVQPGTCIVTLADVSEERQRALRDRGAEIVLAPGRDGRVDLLAVGRVLKDRGIGSLLVEGGATVLTSFLRHRLADQVVAVLAPRVSGAGIDAVGDLGVTLMDGSIGFEDVTFAMLGTDAVFRGHPVWPE